MGTVVGTPKYMAPEQAGGESVDFRSDLYSLACVLYEMLAGDAPYTGPSAHVIIVRSTLGPAPAVRAARPEVPEALEALITRNLSAEPSDRSPSASAVAAAPGGQPDRAGDAGVPPAPPSFGGRRAGARPRRLPAPRVGRGLRPALRRRPGDSARARGPGAARGHLQHARPRHRERRLPGPRLPGLHRSRCSRARRAGGLLAGPRPDGARRCRAGQRLDRESATAARPDAGRLRGAGIRAAPRGHAGRGRRRLRDRAGGPRAGRRDRRPLRRPGPGRPHPPCPGADPDPHRQGQGRSGAAGRGDGRGHDRRRHPARGRRGLLQRGLRLPGGLRLAPGPGVDCRDEPLVRSPAGHGALPRTVSAAAVRGAPAPWRLGRRAGGSPARARPPPGPSRPDRASATPTSSSPSCTGCAASWRKRRRPTGWPASTGSGFSPAWRCCGWRRAIPPRPWSPCVGRWTSRPSSAFGRRCSPRCVEAAIAADDVPTARTAAAELATIAADLGAALSPRALGPGHRRGAPGRGRCSRGARGAAPVGDDLAGAGRARTRRPAPGPSSGGPVGELGDASEAEMNLDAATSVFYRLGATTDLLAVT